MHSLHKGVFGTQKCPKPIFTVSTSSLTERCWWDSLAANHKNRGFNCLEIFQGANGLHHQPKREKIATRLATGPKSWELKGCFVEELSTHLFRLDSSQRAANSFEEHFILTERWVSGGKSDTRERMGASRGCQERVLPEEALENLQSNTGADVVPSCSSSTGGWGLRAEARGSQIWTHPEHR